MTQMTNEINSFRANLSSTFTDTVDGIIRILFSMVSFTSPVCINCVSASNREKSFMLIVTKKKKEEKSRPRELIDDEWRMQCIKCARIPKTSLYVTLSSSNGGRHCICTVVLCSFLVF